jgi:hypothetical protein
VQNLPAAKHIPDGNMKFLFKAYSNKSTVGRPFNGSHLSLTLALVLGLEQNVFAIDTMCWWDEIFLHKHEVVLEVSEVLFAEVHELVHIVINLDVVILVQIETPQYLLSQEVHDEDIGIFAANSDECALGIEGRELCVDTREDHS